MRPPRSLSGAVMPKQSDPIETALSAERRSKCGHDAIPSRTTFSAEGGLGIFKRNGIAVLGMMRTGNKRYRAMGHALYLPPVASNIITMSSSGK